MSKERIERGDIYYADLSGSIRGSEQSGYRPVLVTQANRLNRNSPTVLVAAVTSKLKRPNDETLVLLPMIGGLPKQSMVMAEQRRTISKDRLVDYRCTLDEETMRRVTGALHASGKADHVKKHRKKK